MDLVAYYDAYWRQADDSFDHERLDLLVTRVNPDEHVLEIDCGPGVLAARMRDERGAKVTATDLSGVAVERARAKGIPAVQVDLDSEPLPFENGSFDTVVSNSAVEHRFFFDRCLDEAIRVLRPGGKLVICLPNIAHWLCRWWLLRGRFPYIANSPTDFMHIRFFTIHEAVRLLRQRGAKVTEVDGSVSLWAKEFYPAIVRKRRFRRICKWLAHKWPSLFSRDFVLVGYKMDGLPRGSSIAAGEA